MNNTIESSNLKQAIKDGKISTLRGSDVRLVLFPENVNETAIDEAIDDGFICDLRGSDVRIVRFPKGNN